MQYFPTSFVRCPFCHLVKAPSKKMMPKLPRSVIKNQVLAALYNGFIYGIPSWRILFFSMDNVDCRGNKND